MNFGASSSNFGESGEDIQMYGFKQNEVSVAEVFKFSPPEFSLQMTEN